MSFSGQLLTQAILAQKLNSSELENLLIDGYGGVWKALLKKRDINILLKSSQALEIMMGSETAFSSLLDLAGDELAANDYFTKIICQNAYSAKNLLTIPHYLEYWTKSISNYDRLRSQVNVSGSKVKRQVFNSNGTWLYPEGGIAALSLFVAAMGGGGGYSLYSGSLWQSGGGGGGGEIKTAQFISDLPVSSVNVTLNPAAFGTLMTAAHGETGPTGTGGSATGGGVTTGGGSAVMSDINSPETAVWQAISASQKGGNGGGSYGFGGTPWIVNGANGQSVASGTGGLGGQYTGNISAQGGSGIGSGGGGGYVNTSGTGTGGLSTSAYGCGGGGASMGADGIARSGGSGGPALIVVHWIEL